ncbi:hypothetical protein ABZ370_12220 [Streptomyces sp. NPDC005962]|uniref:hypothetical protein n=1 Tax=Streptomyces sp. NPDC005962 TaxID=3154466 RepID=UPI0033EE3C2E
MLALSAVTLPVAAASAAPAAGHDAYSDLMVDGKFVARTYFNAGEDSFTITKKSNYGNRPYAEYRYTKINGDEQTGTHWGVAALNNPITFDHNFGKNRAVHFRTCVQVDFAIDDCDDWETGYAG